MKKFNLQGISSGTWIRTIVLILALINQALIMFGKSTKQIDVDEWVKYATYGLTTVSALWAWWKNNSFTDKAQDADKILNGDENNVE
jgi:SPP1 family holin